MKKDEKRLMEGKTERSRNKGKIQRTTTRERGKRKENMKNNGKRTGNGKIIIKGRTERSRNKLNIEKTKTREREKTERKIELDMRQKKNTNMKELKAEKG